MRPISCSPARASATGSQDLDARRAHLNAALTEARLTCAHVHGSPYGRLDRRLAAGADPDSDALLRDRADEIVAPRNRAGLASGLERVVRDVDRPVNWRSAAVPVRRGPVRGARHELMRLAGELRHMPNPCPRGVAMAERLLIDPFSPLYTATNGGEIARAARDATQTLFSKPQRALLSAHAPAGVELEDLVLLGPIEVRRRKVPSGRVGVPLTVECWTFPDGSQIHELSSRCRTPQLTKTRATLDFFFTTS